MIERADREKITGFLKDRFGIEEEHLEGYHFYEGRRSVWFSTVEMDPEFFGMKKVEFPGIRALRKINGHYKPTTFFLQILGAHATRNLIDLGREELRELLEEGRLAKDFPGVDEGYVIITYGGEILGCGLYSRGRLKAQFPRGRTEALGLSGLY